MMVKDVHDIKTADKDIVCYKVVREYPDGTLISPFMDYELSLGSVFTDGEISDEFNPPIIRYMDSQSSVLPYGFIGLIKGSIKKMKLKKYHHVLGQGGFHTYTNLFSALGCKRKVFLWERDKNYKLSVVKCVIPKGTRYLQGLTDSVYVGDRGHRSYISKSIKPLKVLKIKKIYNL